MVSLHQCKSEAELVLTLGFIKDTCHAGAPNTISKSDEGWGGGEGSGDGNAPVRCLWSSLRPRCHSSSWRERGSASVRLALTGPGYWEMKGKLQASRISDKIFKG